MGDFSCESAEKTMEWMKAIADMLGRFKHLLDAHVTNFFKDKLWETVDEDWIEHLRSGPVEDFLAIPCGLVQEHWPETLKEFVKNVKSLALPRDPKSPVQIFPYFRATELGTVLSQGMNQKKKHEVEVLSALVSAIAVSVGATTVIDVGSGQGYLAQVLSFMHHLSVIALDASAHHASVTSSRAERIRKHFMSQLRKSQNENKVLEGPRTITRQVFSSDALTVLLKSIADQSSADGKHTGSPSVLAGLHACGDLSANMLRTFVESEHVKAVACIGCCYNLLTDESSEKPNSCCFPMSKGGKSFDFPLGRSARDLGCQSEERWRSFTKEAALQNFQLHTFRAALQLILGKHFGPILVSTPSIGRQGKALRRKINRRAFSSLLVRDEGNSQELLDREPHQLAAEPSDFEATTHPPDRAGVIVEVVANFPSSKSSAKLDLAAWALKAPMISTSLKHGKKLNLTWILLGLTGPYARRSVLWWKLIFSLIGCCFSKSKEMNCR
ncbi:S-adenosyl-L-methionine-dependent methyltransferases superfamily protein isoform X2 [Wolffia australiana]